MFSRFTLVVALVIFTISGSWLRADEARLADARGDSLWEIRWECTDWHRCWRKWKAKFRHAVTQAAGDTQKTRFGLLLDDGWNDRNQRQEIVILVHGFNSYPSEAAALMKAPRQRDFPCGVFAYPNDQPIFDSGKLLADQLARFRTEYPHHSVSLLAYSMGGLVCRVALEVPELDPGNVRRLIMVAPPNHGTSLAHLVCGADIYEFFSSPDPRWRRHPMFSAVEDGLAEAAEDLCPGSIFLNELNARQRNPSVSYSILLGMRGVLNDEELELVRRTLQNLGKNQPWTTTLSAPLLVLMDELDELVTTKGDGVVSLRRGHLEGVADTCVLDFDHLSIIRNPDARSSRVAYAEIMARLTGGVGPE